MISTLDIACNAANPNMRLKTLFSFLSSSSSVRIIDLPKKIGTWNITKVFLQVTYPDGTLISKEAVKVGSAWVATVSGSGIPGTVKDGYAITASGIDEDGNPVSHYELGKGDVVILDSDGAITPGQTTRYVHALSTIPDDPYFGDILIQSDKYYVYNGSIWLSGGSGGGGSTDISNSLRMYGTFEDFDNDPEATKNWGAVISNGCFHVYCPISTNPELGGWRSTFDPSVLSNYALKNWVTENFISVKNSIQTIENEVSATGQILANYAIELGVLSDSALSTNTALISVDQSIVSSNNAINQISTQLSSNEAISGLSTAVSTLQNEVGNAVEDIANISADVSSNYYPKSETSSAQEIDQALQNISVDIDLSDYYTKSETSSAQEVDDALTALQDWVDNNSTVATNVGALQEDMTNVQGDVGNLNDSVSTLQNDVSQLQTDVGNISSVCDALSNAISSGSQIDPDLRRDIDNKFILNNLSTQTLSVQIMSLSDFQAISSSMVSDVFYCISSLSDESGSLNPEDLSAYVYLKNETSSKTELDTRLSDFYEKTETSSAQELQTAFQTLSSDPDLRAAVDNKVKVNNLSVQTLKLNPISKADYDVLSNSGTVDPDAFYLLSDYNPGGGGTIDPSALSGLQDAIDKKIYVNDLSVDSLSVKVLPLSDFEDLSTGGNLQQGVMYYIEGGGSGQPVSLSDYYRKSETSSAVEISTALANISISVDLSEYYQKSETSSAQEISDALTALQNWVENSSNVASNVSALLSDVSQLQTDVGDISSVCDELSNAISSGGQVDLSNYYTKSETSSAAEIQAVVGNINNVLNLLV